MSYFENLGLSVIMILAMFLRDYTGKEKTLQHLAHLIP